MANTITHATYKTPAFFGYVASYVVQEIDGEWRVRLHNTDPAQISEHGQWVEIATCPMIEDACFVAGACADRVTASHHKLFGEVK